MLVRFSPRSSKPWNTGPRGPELIVPMLPHRPSWRGQKASSSGWTSPASSLLACAEPKQVSGAVVVHGLYSPRLTSPPCALGDVIGWVRFPLDTTSPSDQVF